MKELNYAKIHAAERLVGDQLEAERLERIRRRETETRRWRLRGWNAAKELVADRVLTGDPALDVALAGLERDRTVTRTHVKPA